MAKAPVLTWLGWGVSLGAALGTFGTVAFLLTALLAPNAFAAHDGQNAAGFAALILLVSGGGAVVFGPLAIVLALKLRQQGAGWALGLTGGLITIAIGLGAAFSLA